MKKILLATIFSVFYLTSVSAEIGVNVGVSGQVGLFAASGKENLNGATTTASTNTGSEHGEAGWGSIFIEKTLGSRLVLGVEHMPGELSTETTETGKQSQQSGVVNNTVQIDLENMNTFYVLGKVTENLYIKAGMVQVDIITNEKLGTGSTYGNTDMDGTILGFGYNNTFDNGFFVRAESNYTDFDGASLTSTANSNKVTLNQLHGVSAKLSLGKSF